MEKNASNDLKIISRDFTLDMPELIFEEKMMSNKFKKNFSTKKNLKIFKLFLFFIFNIVIFHDNYY